MRLLAGVERTYIGALEPGVDSASIDTTAKLASVFGVNPAAFS